MTPAALLGWAGVALISAGAFSCVWFSCAEGGVLRVALRDHVAGLERQMRALLLHGTEPLAIALVQALGLGAGLAGGALFDATLYLLAPAALFGPRVAFALLRRQRRREIEEQVVNWLPMLSNTLKVTGSLADAFRQTVELVRGPLAQELDLMLKEQKLGLPVQDALRNMAERIRSEIFSTVVAVILTGRTTGGELPTILGQTAAALRERFRLEGVLRKHTAESKSQLIVLLCMPVGIVLLFRQTDPHFFRPLLHGGLAGYIVLGLVVGLWLAAVFAGRKVLAVDM
jgi:tight adherence protein B